MSHRRNLLPTLALLSLPLLTGCLGAPVAGTIETRTTYSAPAVTYGSPPTYQATATAHYPAPQVTMSAPTVHVQAPKVYIPAPPPMPAPKVTFRAPSIQVKAPTIHVQAPPPPAAKVKMTFGGSAGGGAKMKIKGGPTMTVKAGGFQPKMKVKATFNAKGKWKD